jgi:putative protein-disulfide isomerase
MTLRYIYDALCAWCYGIDPHIRAVERRPDIDIVLHGGGLYPLPAPFPSPRAGGVGNFLAEARQRHPQITKDTGMPISDRFQSAFRGMGKSANVSSRPSIAAVLAAEKLQGDGLGMLRELQRSFFARAEPILDKNSVSAIASRQGLRRNVFAKEYDAVMQHDVEQHIQETRELLESVGAEGYPTLILDDGVKKTLIELTQFDDPKGWASRLR